MPEAEGYHSCAACARIVLDLDKTQPPPLEDGRPDQPPEEPLIFFDVTLRDIQQAPPACEVCSWLLSRWARRSKVVDGCSADEDIFLCAETYSASLVNRVPVDEIIFWLWDIRCTSRGVRGRCFTRLSGVHIDLWTLKGDPASSFIHNRPVSQTVWSPENVSLAQSWLRECLTSHQNCGKPALTYMPKRILRVSTATQGVYVVQLQEEVDAAPYAALSYCWGGDQPHKTTKARLQVSNPILRWDHLPKSIQDAVKVTVDLGILYLWVDSLCIAQDDEKELALQIAEMPRIYTQAIMVVMASRATRANEGFLGDIDLNQEAELRARLPFQCPGGLLGSAFLRCQEKSHDPEPIDYRAWCFQEYYLSQRMLTFGSLQNRWVCPSTYLMSSSINIGRFTNGWKWQQDANDSRLNVLELHHETQKHFNTYSVTAIESEREALPRDKWYTLVGTYTRRSLSFTKDRILAISGIAEIISPAMNDEYLAGHWKRSLSRELMWHMLTGHARLSPRPSEYQGPSWSWTATNGEAYFKYDRPVNDPTLTILDAQTELVVAEAAFGAVSRGQVTIRGRLRKALWFGSFDPTGRTNLLKYPPSAGRKEQDNAFLITKVMPDAIEKEFEATDSIAGQPLEVHLLEYGELTGLGLRGLCGMMLREISSGEDPLGRFTRLGIFHVDAKLAKNNPDGVDASFWRQRTGEELRLFEGCELRDIVVE